MATQEVKVCDVYGTTKDVTSFTVRIDSVAIEGGENPSAIDYATLVEVIRVWTVDLSPRALARLVGWIERGVTPPKAAKSGATD